jgi:hypothetical protein
MSPAGKTIAYVASVILILAALPICLLSFIFIWGAFSPSGQSGWIGIGVLGLVVGLVLVGGGVGIVLWVGQRARAAAAGGPSVTLKVDLPGNVRLDSLKCKSCGGALSADNIKMVAGAPVVDCPYCHTTYQMTEEPKW